MFTMIRPLRTVPESESVKCKHCKNAVHGCFKEFCKFDTCQGDVGSE